MQITSVETNQHKISMKELCSKVPASSAALGLVSGRAKDGSFWGGGVMHHLFPLLVGIKSGREHNHCTLTPLFQELTAYFPHFNEIPCLPLPTGFHIYSQAFLSLLQGSRPPLFVQSFSLRAISTLIPIKLLPLWHHCRQESGKRFVLNLIVKIYSFEIKYYFFIVLSLPLCCDQCLNQSQKDQVPNRKIVASFPFVLCCLYINYSIVLSNLKLKCSEQWVTLILISE